jgi:hypothetical protein
VADGQIVEHFARRDDLGLLGQIKGTETRYGGGARSGCVTDAADRAWAVVFSSVFAEPDSQVTARDLAELLGDEYPAEAAPYSYTSRSEPTRIAH